MSVTITIEDPCVLSEIKEVVEEWLDYETKVHETVLKEKSWSVIDEKERDIKELYCQGTIMHRIAEALFPEKHQKMMDIIVDALNEVKENTNA